MNNFFERKCALTNDKYIFRLNILNNDNGYWTIQFNIWCKRIAISIRKSTERGSQCHLTNDECIFIQNYDNVFILYGSTSEAILVVLGVLKERRDSPLGDGENESLTDNGQTSFKTPGGSRKALPCWAKINTKSVLLAQLPSRERTSEPEGERWHDKYSKTWKSRSACYAFISTSFKPLH